MGIVYKREHIIEYDINQLFLKSSVLEYIKLKERLIRLTWDNLRKGNTSVMIYDIDFDRVIKLIKSIGIIDFGNGGVVILKQRRLFKIEYDHQECILSDRNGKLKIIKANKKEKIITDESNDNESGND
jgi:hypothetical protein